LFRFDPNLVAALLTVDCPPKLTRQLANIAGARPDHTIALVLLDRMPDPANGSADRKQIDGAVGSKT